MSEEGRDAGDRRASLDSGQRWGRLVRKSNTAARIFGNAFAAVFRRASLRERLRAVATLAARLSEAGDAARYRSGALPPRRERRCRRRREGTSTA